PYLFEMANIRDQCSWVHGGQAEAATEKSRDLVRMAVARARLLEPLGSRSIAVHPDALVIGGGVAGMTAALNLAEQGFQTHLVEKSARLGGTFRDVRSLRDVPEPAVWLDELIERTTTHPKVRVYLTSRLAAVEGSVGGFRTTIEEDGKTKTVEHGAAIIAIGAGESEPSEYRYGEDHRVLTQRQFEARLDEGTDLGESIVMIQCVGSREPDRPYCSRVCCAQAM
ncbi:MAG: CoB--CoM heterodisulfide reductase iron-sulfur subunit A family protein, partial [Candidatus Bipolaricaulota bacterium]